MFGTYIYCKFAERIEDLCVSPCLYKVYLVCLRMPFSLFFFQYACRKEGMSQALFTMGIRNDLLLDVNQHRLLMCARMAKALEKGEVYLDATTHRMRWKLEKDGVVGNVFDSLDEMEDFLEHLLENRYKSDMCGLGNMDRRVKRRMNVIRERHRSRTNAVPMTFPSRINML